MTPIVLAPAQNNLYIVSDSHLDQDTAPYEEFITMLSSLENPGALVCLGDLFKVWLALPQFWLSMHEQVMAAFEILRSRGVVVIFVVGNREVLFPRKWNETWEKKFPFTHLVHDECRVEWRARRYGFIHGDSINRQDLNHLRWRKIVRSHGFEWFFRAMPGPLARWVADHLEQTLAQSNFKYKSSFPQNEVENFAKDVLDDVDWYFVGHFHQDHQIHLPGKRGILRIVPDWMSQRTILQINPAGHVRTLHFQNGAFR